MVKNLDVSVVVPVYNNECTLNDLTKRICYTLKEYKSEIIYINDSSIDQSLTILKTLEFQNNNVKIINLEKNLGQQVATLQGLLQAKGSYVIVMDADLQDDPKLILALIDMHEKTGDAVFIKRIGKYQKSLRMLTSYLLKTIVKGLIGLDQKAGSYYLLDQTILKDIKRIAVIVTQPYMSILVAFCANEIKYLPARRSKCSTPSGFTFRKRILAGVSAIKCCIHIKRLVKSESL